MNNIRKVTKAQVVDAHIYLERTAETWSRLSANVPKALLEVTQQIHGNLMRATEEVFLAANIKDADEKISHLDMANVYIFVLYAKFQYLVDTRALSAGGFNEIMRQMTEAQTQIKKWKNALKSAQKND